MAACTKGVHHPFSPRAPSSEEGESLADAVARPQHGATRPDQVPGAAGGTAEVL